MADFENVTETVDETTKINQNQQQNVAKASGKLKIGYVYSLELLKQCDRVPNLIERASMVHQLIESFGLLERVIPISCDKCDEDLLDGFHSADYLNYIRGNIDEEDEENDEYGLGYDCPPLEKLYDFIRTIAGGSLAAAKALVAGTVDVAVNFCGGWHHAQRDQASGFCYVNDCVLAILELQKRFKRVLYIDLDIHHGDGVENAFAFSRKVFTLSFHKCEEGYFPGTGSVNDIGLGGGRFYTCNVPLKDGASDQTFIKVFETVFDKVARRFRPEAIVCQCGADGLSYDPLGTFNLTPAAYNRCCTAITLSSADGVGLPPKLLVLGGGGYSHANAARCFASILASLTGTRLPSDIPEHDFFDRYGPAFDTELTPSLRRDENHDHYVTSLLQTVLSNLEHVSSGP